MNNQIVREDDAVSSGEDISALRDNYISSQSDTEKLTSFLDSIDGWFLEFNRDNLITYSNQRVQSVLGYSPLEVIGKSIFDFVPKSEINAVSQGLLSRISFSQRISNFIFPCLNKNGQIINLEFNANPFYETSTDSYGYRGICTISDNSTDKDSIPSAAGLIFNQLVEAIIFIDPDMKIRYANQSFYDLFGYSESETIGKPLSSLSVEGQHSSYQPDAVSTHLLEHGIWQGEVRRKTKNGEYIPVMINAKAIYNNKGHFQGYIGTYLDLRNVNKSSITVKKALKKIIEAIAGSIEAKNPMKDKHSFSVSDLAVAIALDLQKDYHFIEGLTIGAILHDIGYLLIPTEFVNRQSAKTDIETNIMRNHTIHGYEILKNLNLPWPVAEMILQHHEHLDGSGFPNHLKGSEIIEEARILAVADFVVTMTNEVSHGNMSFSIDNVVHELEANIDSHYDANVVASCCRLIRNKEVGLNII